VEWEEGNGAGGRMPDRRTVHAAYANIYCASDERRFDEKWKRAAEYY
jgi:hypothetical protein